MNHFETKIHLKSKIIHLAKFINLIKHHKQVIDNILKNDLKFTDYYDDINKFELLFYEITGLRRDLNILDLSKKDNLECLLIEIEDALCRAQLNFDKLFYILNNQFKDVNYATVENELNCLNCLLVVINLSLLNKEPDILNNYINRNKRTSKKFCDSIFVDLCSSINISEGEWKDILVLRKLKKKIRQEIKESKVHLKLLLNITTKNYKLDVIEGNFEWIPNS